MRDIRQIGFATRNLMKYIRYDKDKKMKQGQRNQKRMKVIRQKTQKHLIESIHKKAGKMLLLLIMILIWNMILFTILKSWKIITTKSYKCYFSETKQDYEVFDETTDFNTDEEVDTEMEGTAEITKFRLDNEVLNNVAVKSNKNTELNTNESVAKLVTKLSV